jgi:hypothetical protein
MFPSITLPETTQPAGGQAMRIDGTTGGQTSLGFNLTNASRVNTPDNPAADSSTAGPATAAGQFRAGSEFLPLVSVLGGIPQVRQDVIGDVVSRLGGGELATPQARQQTVESMLGSGPGRG